MGDKDDIELLQYLDRQSSDDRLDFYDYIFRRALTTWQMGLASAVGVLSTFATGLLLAQNGYPISIALLVTLPLGVLACVLLYGLMFILRVRLMKEEPRSRNFVRLLQDRSRHAR